MRREIFTVDTHTAGEPTRIVIAGMRNPGASTASRYREWLMSNEDEIRLALMREPRGHESMFGAVLFAPASKAGVDEPRNGVVFMDGGGYLTMCVHGSMGVVAALTELGMLELNENGWVETSLETPSGWVQARNVVSEAHRHQVRLEGIPSFMMEQDVVVSLPTGDAVRIDVAFGGNITAIIDAGQLIDVGLSTRISELVDLGRWLRRELKGRFEHPTQPGFDEIQLVEYVATCESNSRTLVTFGDGAVDRSPCGSGLSARLAQLHARGELSTGEPYITRGPVGTKFEGVIRGLTDVGGVTAVRPEISGDAYVTGYHRFVVPKSDPLATGFALRDEWMSE